MRQKLTDYEYLNFDLFEVDFNLIIQNCLSFNQEDTIYYRTALRMRTQCKPIIKAARKRIKQAGIDPQTGMHMEKPPVVCNGEDRTAGGLLSPTEGGKYYGCSAYIVSSMVTIRFYAQCL